MVSEFEHINLNEVDDSFKPVPVGVYTLEINKLEYKKISVKKADSQYFGQEVPVVKGSYTIVDDENYSGRKLWHNFFLPAGIAQKMLKKQMQVTGVLQGAGEPLEEYVKQFELLNPPARFVVPVGQEPDRNDPDNMTNVISFFQSKPA